MPKLQGYRIHNPVTNLFSSGGRGPKWTKKGKVWSNIGHLKNHLNLFVNSYTGDTISVYDVYNDCIIYDVTTGERLKETPMELMLDYVKRQKQEYKHLKNKTTTILNPHW